MLLERVGPCVEWGYLELAQIACERTDADDLLASADRALDIAVDFGDVDLEAQATADGGLALVTMGRTKEGLARLDAALAAIAAGEVTPIVAGICFCSMLTACDRTADVRRAQEWTGIIAKMIRGLRESTTHPPHPLSRRLRFGAAGRRSVAGGRGVDDRSARPRRRPDPAASGTHDCPSRGTANRTGSGRGRRRAPRPVRGPSHAAALRWRESTCGAASLILPSRFCNAASGSWSPTHCASVPLLSLMVVAEIQRGDLGRGSRGSGWTRTDRERLGCRRTRRRRCRGARSRARGVWTTMRRSILRFEEAIGTLDSDERPLLLATVRLEFADVLARSGDHAAAIAEARAALACFERLGADTYRDQAAALLRSLGDTARARPQRADDVASALSAREQEVLELVSLGLSNAEIASRLFISPKTAEHHVGRILTKLGVRSRGEAAALAVRLAAAARE